MLRSKGVCRRERQKREMEELHVDFRFGCAMKNGKRESGRGKKRKKADGRERV